MHQVSVRARELVADPDPGRALFELFADMVRSAQSDRALFEAVDEAFLSVADIREAHADLVSVLDQLVVRAQEAGAVRDDVGALDLLMLFKGVCEASRPFNDPELAARQLELMWAALRPVEPGDRLRGRPPTLEDVDHTHG
jgi:hypothetical protein